MIPNSDYIKKNVVNTEKCQFRVPIGKKVLTCEWRYKMEGGEKIQYLWTGKVDEYKTYTANVTVPQFDPNVPVGFIAGLDNDIFNQMEKKEREEVRKGINAAKIGFGVTEGWHIAKCVALIGLVTGSVTFANDACKAKNFMANFNSEVAGLIGSKKSDGFVALENQFIPKSYTHPKTKQTITLLNVVLGEDKKNGYKGMSKKTHQNIVGSSDAFEIADEMVREARKLRKR
jgi:hypothetical protein